MRRESKVQCCVCEDRIREGVRKYSATVSVLLRVYVVVKTEKRVKMGDCLSKSCRNKYDWWRRLMSGDFHELDLSLENDPNDQNEESTVRVFSTLYIFSVVLKPMEIDVAAATPAITEHENESEEEDDKNKIGSVKLPVWRTSKSHR